MAYNKIITSEGNVQFQTADGSIINVHPFHIYTTFNEDTVSFILIAMPKSSGLAIFTSKASDLEVDGTVYTIEQLPNALSEAFAKAGAVARYEIVDELPTSGQSNTIYLVPKEEGEGYDEYIYVNGEWELIGDTDIELDRYVDKETFSGYTADTLVLINTVSGNVITESERAISAETALQEAIDAEASARTADVEALSGAVDSVSSALTNEVSARISADTELDGKIEIVSGQVISESERAISAETSLSSAIDTEISNREAADSVISGAVDNVSTDLSNEVQRAISAETELSDKIDAVSGDVEDVQAEVDVLSAALEDEVSARTQADEALDDKIDGKVVELTQAEYDSLVDKDPLVLYVITDAVEVNMNDYYKKTETSGATEIQTALDAKLNTSDFNTYSANTQTAINGKQDTLVAGSGITISGNVISAEAQPIIVDPSLDSGSTNAVANSAITIAIDELSASSVTNCDNVVIEDVIPTPPSTIVDENVKVSWEDDYTETYAVDYEGNIGDGVEHVGYNVSKLEFGSFTTEISYNFRFSADECYSDLKTVIFNGNVNLGEVNTPFASAFNLEAVYFYAPNPSAITCDNFDDGFLNYVYNGCETYETSAATYPIYVADLAAYSGATLYNDGNNDVTWGQHFGNRLQEIPKGKKLVLTDIEDRLAEDEEVTAAALNNINDRLSEDEEVTAAGLNAVNDKFDGLQLKKLSQAEYDNLQTKNSNTLYIITD